MLFTSVLDAADRLLPWCSCTVAGGAEYSEAPLPDEADVEFVESPIGIDKVEPPPPKRPIQIPLLLQETVLLGSLKTGVALTGHHFNPQQWAAALPQKPALPEIEVHVASDPNYAQEVVAARQRRLGITSQIQEWHCISLGSFCATASALKALGLRGESKPLDWARSSLSGVISLLERRFEGFFERGGEVSTEAGISIYPLRWGGSFWHHDPDAPGDVAKLQTRIDRMLQITGKLLFVRAANDIVELFEIPQLLKSLRAAYPGRTIKVLVLLDFQAQTWLWRVDEFGDDVLVATVDRAVFQDPALATIPKEHFSRVFMDRCMEAYAASIAWALRYWTGSENHHKPWLIPSAGALSAISVPFTAGDVKRDSFWPRWLAPESAVKL